MKDFNKTLKTYYLQLVELMGKEDAEAYVKKINYNYAAITLKILFLRLKINYKTNPRPFILILSIIIALVVLYFLDLFLII